MRLGEAERIFIMALMRSFRRTLSTVKLAPLYVIQKTTRRVSRNLAYYNTKPRMREEEKQKMFILFVNFLVDWREKAEQWKMKKIIDNSGKG